MKNQLTLEGNGHQDEKILSIVNSFNSANILTVCKGFTAPKIQAQCWPILSE